MKKLTLAIFVALLASFAVAQSPGGMRGGGQRMDPKARMEKMTKDLSLTPAQVNKVSALMKARQEEMKKMLGGKKPDRKTMGPMFKKMGDEYSASMKKILTPTQYEKFDKMQKARMSRMGGRGGMRGPGGPGGPPKGGA